MSHVTRTADGLPTETGPWNWTEIPPYADNDVYVGREIATPAVTIRGLHCLAGAAAPTHAHPYDQWAMVLEGVVTICVEGVGGAKPTAHRLEKGAVLLIPANMLHWTVYETECDLLEVGLGCDPA